MKTLIPNIFHFVFGLKKQTEPFHLVHYLCIESCFQVNQPDAIHFYYHYEPFGKYWDMIKGKVIPIKVDLTPIVSGYKYKDRFIKKFRYAHQSDFIRLEKLNEFGGVYADIDTIFVNKVPDVLFTKPFVLGREQDIVDPKTGQLTSSLCNAFIMSEKRSEFLAKWMHDMDKSFDGTWSNHSTLLPQQLSRKHPKLIHVEPIRSFYKYTFNNKRINSLFLKCDTDFEGVYSIHLWSHLWWDKSRVDFSICHAGMLTEENVRNLDTTYNIIARKFLPETTTLEPELSMRTPNAVSYGKGYISKLISVARSYRNWLSYSANQKYLNKYVRILMRIALFTFISNWIFPDTKGRLDYAKRQRLQYIVKRRLQARNLFENDIIDNVTVYDEYRISDERFLPTTTILDIGAHIGSFSYLCYLKGSRNIYAYEADTVNYNLLTTNLCDLNGVHLFNLAVFRSDLAPGYNLKYSEYLDDNTGGSNVLAGGKVIDLDNQQVFEKAQDTSQKVNVISLDKILSGFDYVDLMKIDCEGSEYPILLTSTQLHKVKRIVGEYHEVDAHMMTFLDTKSKVGDCIEYSGHLIKEKLEQSGFNVTITPMLNHHGLFFARR